MIWTSACQHWQPERQLIPAQRSRSYTTCWDTIPPSRRLCERPTCSRHSCRRSVRNTAPRRCPAGCFTRNPKVLASQDRGQPRARCPRPRGAGCRRLAGAGVLGMRAEGAGAAAGRCRGRRGHAEARHLRPTTRFNLSDLPDAVSGQAPRLHRGSCLLPRGVELPGPETRRYDA